MKKLFTFFILLLFILQLNAQNEILKFDKRFVHCINKWVAFSYDKKDNSFSYGYVYLSSAQSISLRLMGTISLDSNGKFVPKNTFDSLGTMMTYRLTPEYNRKIVGLIPHKRIKEIGVEEFPKAYNYSKIDTLTATGLYNLGFLFNAWEECNDALKYLEKANEINSRYDGLAVELAFSYNCLKQYNKAAETLKNALKNSPDNCYYYKELVYSLQNTNNEKEVESVILKGIEVCNDNSMKAEMVYNIAQMYYRKKDKINLKKWLLAAKKYPHNNKAMENGFQGMESELEKF